MEKEAGVKKNGQGKKHEKIQKPETKETKKVTAENKSQEITPETKPKKSKKEKTPKKGKAERNEFGHAVGTQSAIIDQMLAKGSDLKSIAEKIGSSRGRVRAHVKHLQKDHKLSVSEKGGTWTLKK